MDDRDNKPILLKTARDNIIGLDILRIVSAFMVFLFHINIHLNFRTGIAWMDTVISVGATFMVAFFMLSGFVLTYFYGQTDMLDSTMKIMSFYKKRILRIYPPYLIYFVIILLFGLYLPSDKRMLFTLIPIDLVGMQAFFPNSFSYIGNDGSWFVSAILFLYLIFPLLSKLLEVTPTKALWIAAMGCYFAAAHISVARMINGGDFTVYYANPIFRLPEFLLGMVLGKWQRENSITAKEGSKHTLMKTLFICVVAATLYCAGVYILFDKNIYGMDFFRTNYLSYNILAFPVFAVLIMALSHLKTSTLPKVHRLSKFINMASKLSFSFFLTQGFAIKITGLWIKNAYCGFAIDGDKKILLLSLLLNLCLSAVMYGVSEKVINTVVKAKCRCDG